MTGIANYMPVYIRKNGKVGICKIESLARDFGGEPHVVETWSNHGWTRIKRVIKRPYDSEDWMMRIVTHHGLVDITYDRPILNVFEQRILPNDLSIGDNLLHYVLDDNVADLHYQNMNDIYVNSEDMIHATKYVNSRRDWTNDRSGEADEVRGRFTRTEGEREYQINNSRDSHIIHITTNPEGFQGDAYSIKQIYEIPYRNEYVYDLVTENGHYAAGVGNIII